MIIINLKGYQLAIFKVTKEDALHITVQTENGIINECDFNEQIAIQKNMIEAYKLIYRKLPIEQIEKIIKKSLDNSKQILILIIK